MTRLVLVRHGESNVMVAGMIGGLASCTGLSPLGRQQATALRDRWHAHPDDVNPVDTVMASTMPRAMETADIVVPALGGHDVLHDPELCEHHPGSADGLLYRDFLSGRDDIDWGSLSPYDEVFPDGETIAQFHHRVAAALHRIVRAHEGQRLVLFVHGGVIDVALRWALHLPITGVFETWTRTCSITELEHAGPRWRLHRYNDAAHLVGLPDRTPVDALDADGG